LLAHSQVLPISPTDASTGPAALVARSRRQSSLPTAPQALGDVMDERGRTRP
jgi:hypothetical protein